jgi:hypothetical protein
MPEAGKRDLNEELEFQHKSTGQDLEPLWFCPIDSLLFKNHKVVVALMKRNMS